MRDEVLEISVKEKFEEGDKVLWGDKEVTVHRVNPKYHRMDSKRPYAEWENGLEVKNESGNVFWTWKKHVRPSN